MNSNPDWLIEALKIGYERGDAGLSFRELNQELTKRGRRELSKSEQYAWRYWFHRTFITGWYGQMNGAPDRGSDMNLFHTASDDERGILDSKGTMDYLTFLSYQQALKSSSVAQRTATMAIVVAILLGLFQLVC